MPGRIVELAQSILENSIKYEEFFEKNSLPPPSLSASSFPEPKLPPDVLAARDAVLCASTDLDALISGPTEVVRLSATHHAHLTAVQAVYRYDIANTVPLDGEVSFAELSEKTGLKSDELKRLMRYMISCNIFSEPTPGSIAHNGPSLALAKIEELREWTGMVTEELWPAAVKTVDAMKQWPATEEPDQAGFQLAHNTTDTSLKNIMSDPRRGKRFAKAMSLFARAPGMQPECLVGLFPWHDLVAGKDGGSQPVFVDIGGSHGTVDVVLAREVPQMKFIVQDLPNVVASATVPSELQSRIEYVAHDFFTEQPVRGADVYFLRWVLHDWSDKYAANILEKLVPALEPGSRVLVNEFCIPPPGHIPAHKEKFMRSFDLVMLTLQNSKEREVEDWVKLFKGVDPRFVFKGVKTAPGSPMALLEFQWT